MIYYKSLVGSKRSTELAVNFPDLLTEQVLEAPSHTSK